MVRSGGRLIVPLLVLALAGPLVGEAEHGFEVGESPPAETPGQCPEALGDARVEPVRRIFLARLGTKPCADTERLEVDAGGRVIEDDGREGTRTPVVCSDEMEGQVPLGGAGREPFL